VKPTLAFYFDVPLPEAIRRIMDGRPQLKYYEAGLDLELSSDPEESFRRYQALIKHEYEGVVGEFGLVRMDATQTLIQQQQQMRALVQPHLDGVMRFNSGELREALVKEGLLGRYLTSPGPVAP
jgi:dTMP kinase